jgi:hypothetical protein
MAYVLFLSGWAGFAPLFPRLSGACEFAVPFTPEYPDEDAVFRRLDTGGGTLLAWSTGAHMALRHGACFRNFSRIVLVAPFLRFTDSLPARIVRSMLQELDKDPKRLLDNFYTTCGVHDAPREIHCNAALLADGLHYLLESEVTQVPAFEPERCLLVQPQKDRVVRAKAARAVELMLDGIPVKQVPGGHCLSEEILEDIGDLACPPA